jgi:hypothetical protein
MRMDTIDLINSSTLDLDELARRLEEALEAETPESLRKWLEEIRKVDNERNLKDLF